MYYSYSMGGQHHSTRHSSIVKDMNKTFSSAIPEGRVKFIRDFRRRVSKKYLVQLIIIIASYLNMLTNLFHFKGNKEDSTKPSGMVQIISIQLLVQFIANCVC